ncbi:hypothetical protein ACHHYP_03622 [Achlya hypogyna]|uniref:Secreted protein n=1 Tax=Achlya hypogyna TaxID=1202772 RepID=A0A1V9ZQV4_ACHHY|nr:hypothetical protein ACHHYP_03622 [Achlya hypogyna]
MQLLRSLLLLATAVSAAFSPVDPTDPFVVAASAKFMETYDRFLSDVFAIVSSKTILNAQVFKHPVELPDALDIDEPIYMAGATYKLNVLLELQFDTPEFKGDPYVTVANCIFVCTNDTAGSVDCSGRTFEQFRRTEEPIESIKMAPVRSFLNEALGHKYDDALFEMTAYEVQHDSIEGDVVEYYRFKAEGEPVECEFAAYRKASTGARSMLYFDDKCIDAKYKGLSLDQIERDERLHMALLLGTFGLVATIAIGAAIYRRAVATKSRGTYRHVRFQPSETPRASRNSPVLA